MKRAYLVLYVHDQARATRFYTHALGVTPLLDVPGMTELPLVEGAVLGLMPAAGIQRLLGPGGLPDPRGEGLPPRAEVYLMVEDAGAHHARALEAGARELSPLQARDWGHTVAYSLDLDGHVLAFAEEP